MKKIIAIFTLVIYAMCFSQPISAISEYGETMMNANIQKSQSVVYDNTTEEDIEFTEDKENQTNNITTNKDFSLDELTVHDDVCIAERSVNMDETPFNIVVESNNNEGVIFNFTYVEEFNSDDVHVYLYKYINEDLNNVVGSKTEEVQLKEKTELVYSWEPTLNNIEFEAEDKLAATKYNLTVIINSPDERNEYFCDISVYNPKAIKKFISQKKTYTKQLYNIEGNNINKSFEFNEEKDLNSERNSKVPKQEFTYSVFITNFTYGKNTKYGNMIKSAGTINESESNNTMATANQIYNDYDVRGYLSSNTDIDYFKVTYSTSGPTNFYLGNLSDTVEYSITIYDYNGMFLTSMRNDQGDCTYAQRLNMYVYAGYTYYFKIEKSIPDSYPSNYIQYLFRTRRVTENTTFTPHDSYEWNDYHGKAYQLFEANNTVGVQSRTYYANIHTDNQLDFDYYKVIFNQDVVIQVQLNNLTGIDSMLSLFDNYNNPPLFQEWQEEYDDEYDDYIKATTRLEAGTYYIVVEKATPTTQNYELKVLWEDLNIDEYEPNDSFATATQISRGNVYSATFHWYDDVDYYKLVADITRTHFIKLDASVSFGCDVTVYNASFNQIGYKSIDTNNNVLEINFNSNNVYYIRVSHVGGYNVEYDLQCYTDDYGDDFASATQVFIGTSVSGMINYGGDNDYFKFIPSQSGLYTFYTTGTLDTYGYLYNSSLSLIKSNDDSGSGTNFKIVYRLVSGNTYYIRVRAYNSTYTGAYTFWVIRGDDHPDNFSGTPTLLTLNSSVSGVIDDSSDVDCFSFTPTINGTYKIYTTGSTNTAGILYDTDKVTELCTSYNSPGTTNFRLAKTLKANKTYYVRVSPETTSNSGTYNIYAMRISNPTDYMFDTQWGLQNIGQTIDNSVGTLGIDINVLPVWEYTKGAGVTIGIMDTGTDITHEDLEDNISTDVSGYNFVYENNDLMPDVTETHGTHVAGIAGAVANSIGISGVAPEADLVSLTLVDVPYDPMAPANNSQMDAFIDAIGYCVDNDIGIVNCSFWMPNWLGCTEASYVELRQNIASASDILFVVAAGNDGVDLSNITNDYRPMIFNTWNMINVAAIKNTGALDLYSNYGSNVHVAAPGTDIISTIPTDDYGFKTGTSMAAPHVTGVAALLKSYYPNLTVTQLKDRIISPNNVTYRSELSGKVSSSGILNAWYAFTNDSTHPRTATYINGSESTEGFEYNRVYASEYTGILESNVKEFINNTLNNALNNRQIKENNSDSNSILTRRIYVNINDGVDKDALINRISPKAIKIKEIPLTGSIMLEYETVEEAVAAVLLFNSYDVVRYAEPLYNVELVPSK